MTSNTENQGKALETVKWVLVALILIGTVIGNNIFSEESVLIRAVAVIIAAVIAGGIALQTSKGRNALEFASESRTEVRKVVWPTRQEAIQTTLIVLVVTAIMALVLWGLDGILVRVVAFITDVKV
ncbi:preprotein translocase subunit SecE [Moritella viscosa]|uniref:Protein translocase subunit SecE n=1 Tax=Moritella viscosa TaxID=80854 RepID=A0A090K3B7_9GAMM|nr:preprotein translocase subunit SecE [Moritella viscosa]CED58248.1 preprotein translocase sece subunit [Moritella viscosa]SGY94622.1 Preprotein translocase, membrane component, transport across innermembrane (General Secretory Pathway) [Moritella viscosa]SGY99698.1 Preprotein translocase, membrane component, transport across innermembrane (General Secretory Pathway) [Moritella viscosa]SGZ00183.1 Preprotein translocase, membrane component, transport across innermembrane (General Secretory Path